MNGDKWLDQHIRDNWHDPESRAGLEKGKRMVEENIGRKLPDLPVVAELKAKDRDLGNQKKASAITSLEPEIRV